MEKSSSDPGLRNSESLESCAIPNSTSINRSDEIEDLTVSKSDLFGAVRGSLLDSLRSR